MQMPLWDHLGELRKRMFKVFIAVGVLTGLSFFCSDWMLQCLLKPFPDASQGLISLQPAGVFMESMRLALISGFVLTLPLILYQVWSFVSPGLKSFEAKAFLISLYAGTFLFLIGVGFAYFLVIPKALVFFWDYSRGLGILPSWTIEHYLNFVLMFLLSFGLAFELPLVLVLMVRFNIVSVQWLSQKRAHVVIALAVIAAILTPPDVMSQIMLLVPLWLLYEISLLVAKTLYGSSEMK
ncbi:MAG: twin-arginine translocase subunit TatC [Deltaproteobacteria bacterium]|nr:twin-arginine translocase subunit TatC [Deltaproteobacteria bacterium]